MLFWGGSFKGFLKGVYKGSIVGFYGIGAFIITYTVLGVPYYNCRNLSSFLRPIYYSGSSFGFELLTNHLSACPEVAMDRPGLVYVIGFRGLGFRGFGFRV